MLMQAFDYGIGPIFDGRLYATVAPPQPTYPLCIYQSQDNGGIKFDTFSRNGWRGFITFRSIDTTLSGAWNKVLELVNAIPAVVASGYLIEYMPNHPQWFPVERVTQGNLYTAAIIVEFQVSITV
jgi:hypothetical protein